MKKIALIVAGGSGQRMNSELPKQFLLLNGKPILWYSINAFISAYTDIEVIVVLPAAYLEKGETIKDLFAEKERILLVEGGATRFHSVQNGLRQIKDRSVIFIHDGVRCLVSQDLIKRCFDQTIIKGSAIPAVAATDSIRIVCGDTSKIEDRNNVRIIQTPQTFLSEIILPAFEQVYTPAFTDEATVVEAYGKEVYLMEGEYSNIKITRPLDLILASKLMEAYSVFN